MSQNLVVCRGVNTVAEAHRMISEAHSEVAMTERTCPEWYELPKNGDFNVEDRQSGERPKSVVDEELEHEGSCQAQEELEEHWEGVNKQ